MSAEDTRILPTERPATPAADAGTVLRADPVPPFGIPPGTLLVNTYRVERLLGGGGMGEVYLARHTGLGTAHAIKVIRPSMALDRQVMELFYREARVLRGVRHEGVVSYDGFVRDDQGRDYLVMEYVEGSSLAERMRRGPLSPEEVLLLRDRLAAGLGEAHRKGAVHRDLSPDNVVLPGDRIEAAKLIDFGVCKLTDPTQETILGSSFAGKYRYASPEQLGLFGGAVDARSDIYSLGLVLAAAAQGRPLDMGDSIEGALRSRQRVPDLAGIPEPLRAWLAAMLQPNPASRPESLEALLARWPAGKVVKGSSPQSGRPRAGDRTTGGSRAKPAIVAGGALVALALAGGLYVLLKPLEQQTTTDATKTEPGPGPTIREPKKPEGPSESTDSPAGELEAFLGGGRDDEALSAAKALIAAREGGAPGTTLPAVPFMTLAGRLQAAGRPDDAFALAEALIAAGQSPPVEPLWSLAQDLRAAGRTDPYFYLVRALANRDHAPGAFALAELYDPLHWSETASPFSKPRPDKAREWYERAAALGVPEARGRLDALGQASPAE